MIDITMLYNNVSFRSDLVTGWGLACMIEGSGRTVLFDTGGDGKVLLSNLRRLGKDPTRFDAVVLSHAHGDHTGGLEDFLTVAGKVELYVPEAFPDSFKEGAECLGHKVNAVDEPVAISDDLFSTGQMGSGLNEHALVLKTAEGLVVIMGCAHPGLVSMLKKAKRVGADELYLAMGGFHLMGYSDTEIKDITQTLKGLGLKKIAPSHCTGNRPMHVFKEVWKDSFIDMGCGAHLAVSPCEA